MYKKAFGSFPSSADTYRAWGLLFDPDWPFLENPRESRPMANPLYYASLMGLPRTVEPLLEKGVDINAHGGRFDYAIRIASLLGHQRIIRLLLETGADINAQGHKFCSALQAASAEGHTETVRILLEAGSDINLRGGARYNTALGIATEEGHKKVVKLLLGEGADVNARGGEYGTALLMASLLCHRP